MAANGQHGSVDRTSSHAHLFISSISYLASDQMVDEDCRPCSRPDESRELDEAEHVHPDKRKSTRPRRRSLRNDGRRPTEQRCGGDHEARSPAIVALRLDLLLDVLEELEGA